MIVSHLLLILHKKYSFISLCLKLEMWQKVAKFKGAEYFRKALYVQTRSHAHVCMGGEDEILTCFLQPNMHHNKSFLAMTFFAL